MDNPKEIPDQIFDLPAIQNDLETDAIWYQTEEDGEFETQVYLGRTYSLRPSGKHYEPWATGNITPCDHCGGEGTIENRNADPKLEANCKAFDVLLTGFTMDKFGPFCDGKWPEPLTKALEGLRATTDLFQPRLTCPNCMGHGSRDIYLDELWRNQATEELESIGCYMTSGEGDPTDVFASQCRTEEELPEGAVIHRFQAEESPEPEDEQGQPPDDESEQGASSDHP